MGARDHTYIHARYHPSPRISCGREGLVARNDDGVFRTHRAASGQPAVGAPSRVRAAPRRPSGTGAIRRRTRSGRNRCPHGRPPRATASGRPGGAAATQLPPHPPLPLLLPLPLSHCRCHCRPPIVLPCCVTAALPSQQQRETAPGGPQLPAPPGSHAPPPPPPPPPPPAAGGVESRPPGPGRSCTAGPGCTASCHRSAGR